MRLTQVTALLIAATAPAWGIGTPERVWGPAVQRIQKAATIQGAEARESAIRAALRDGLLTSNREIADQVFIFLSESSRWIDLQPFSDELEEFAKSDPGHRGIWLLDDNAVDHSPEEVRKALYRQAIEEGTTRLKRGRPLTRASAIVMAAFDGMTDLQPLIEKYGPLVEERWKQSLQFSSIPALFELTAGAHDRDTAADKAATQLAAMNDESLRARMESDDGFRTAVTRMTDYLCAKNPFTGRSAQGCQKVKDVVERQTALERQKTQSSNLSASGHRSAPPEWLERWKERIH
jgi:hypothetical protein